jgi:AraC-like DNA-binding protein
LNIKKGKIFVIKGKVMQNTVYYPPENLFSNQLYIDKVSDAKVDSDYYPRKGGILPTNHGLDFITEGCGILTTENTEIIEFAQDSIIVLPREKWYSYRPHSGGFFKHQWIRFSGPLAEKIMSIFPANAPQVLVPEKTEDIRKIFAAILSLSSRGTETASMQATGKLCSLLTETAALSRETPFTTDRSIDIIERFMKFARLNLRTRKLDLDKFLKQEKIGYESFRKKFKQATGSYPHSFWINIKLEAAKNLLDHSEKNISEIADFLCFSDIYEFSAFFKRKMGISPRKFRSG